MGLTLRQAADLCGKSRSTIHRALKSGKLSGARDDDGSWSIDPSELARVFPWDTAGQAQRDTKGQPETPPRDHESREVDVLRVKVEMLERLLESEQVSREKAEDRADKAEARSHELNKRVLLIEEERQAKKSNATSKPSIRAILSRLIGS